MWRLTDGRVDHPAHYGGADNPYEAIKVIEAWGLGFCLGNTIKSRSEVQLLAGVLRGGRSASGPLSEDVPELYAKLSAAGGQR